MKRVNYHLTDDQIAKLQSLSEKTGLSVAELIRRAIDAYLEREAKRAEKERP
jgi:predicted DNA-binding protein